MATGPTVTGPEASRPKCMTEREWLLWCEANAVLYPEVRAPEPCRDCTPEHRAQMGHDGLCGAEDLRLCSTCREMRPVMDFYRDRTRADGLSYICKGCRCTRKNLAA